LRHSLSIFRFFGPFRPFSPLFPPFFPLFSSIFFTLPHSPPHFQNFTGQFLPFSPLFPPATLFCSLPGSASSAFIYYVYIYYIYTLRSRGLPASFLTRTKKYLSQSTSIL
jgi:hypothetical protein